jgi:pimeloyl-ACP methyl ester carboxylesterase
MTSLPPPLDGAARLDLGDVACWVGGSGAPLLLVHSVNAAASAAEVRPLYLHYRATHTVYAPDLPGFGSSDRSERAYTPRLMTDAIHRVADAIRERHGSAPFDALAVSLGTEFLARAACEQPGHYRSLALVSPTGLSGLTRRRAAPGTTREVPGLRRVLSARPWADALYRGLTRPGVIRYFLARTWGSARIDETLWAYDVLTARQPGARHAPLHFLAAALFSADIHVLYESLAAPVWMSHGVRGDFTDYRGRVLVDPEGRWQVSVYDSGALPYFEHPEAFFAAWDRFRAGAAGVAAPNR